MQNCKLAPGKIELIGHPHRLLVKVWADVSTIPLHDSSPEQLCTVEEHSREEGGDQKKRKTNEQSKALHNNKTTLCASINKALQLWQNFLELTSPNHTIIHSTRRLSLRPRSNFIISQCQTEGQCSPVDFQRRTS